MSGPDLDLEKPTAVGVLDRLTTNVALSLIAVLPTLFFALAMPWRLGPLLREDDPEGRQGMCLAPGAFFPLSLFVFLMAAALISTPEAAERDGSFIGPGLAISIQTAISDGNVWRAIAAVLPIYVFSVIVGTVSVGLAPLTKQNWTLRVSLRATFYVIATVLSCVIILTAMAEWSRDVTEANDVAEFIYIVSPIFVFGPIFWMYLWFFRSGGDVAWWRSVLLSFAMLAIMLGVIIVLGLLAGL
ncbi:MAG: hypothetical protein AAGF20_02750 [Pseudomonadota bacterium]